MGVLAGRVFWRWVRGLFRGSFDVGMGWDFGGEELGERFFVCYFCFWGDCNVILTVLGEDLALPLLILFIIFNVSILYLSIN